MCNLRIRQHSAPWYYPAQTVRTMRPQIARAMHAVKHHFSNRHDPIEGARYRKAARNWAQSVKDIDAGSGYSTALAQTLGKLETPIWKPET
jgi:hypothetical protein